MNHRRATRLLSIPAAAVLCLAGGAAGEAGTIRVKGAGAGLAPTLQAALDAADPGDTILVAPGTYSELLRIENKHLTILGEAGAEATIIDGGFMGRVLTIVQSGQPVVLEGLTFQSGYAGGIETNSQGGAVAALTSPLTVRDCVFRQNLANNVGGAIYATILPGYPRGPDPPVPFGDLIVTGSLFHENRSGDEGGAVFVCETPSFFYDCVFLDNSGLQGAAVSMLQRSHQIVGCVFENNTARLDGGAIIYSGDGSLILEESLFTENAGECGGAVRMVDGLQLSLTRCWFVDNRAVEGGAIHATGPSFLADRVLWLRQSATKIGGALVLLQLPAATIQRCTWLENTAPRGASFRIDSQTLSVERSIVGDEAEDAADCTPATSVTSTCNVGGRTTGDCLTFVARFPVLACATLPQGLCTLPSPDGCGRVGHADETCPECVTPVRSATWGSLKIRY